MSREIPLTKGFVAIVDDEDYAELSQYTWHWQAPDYATRTENGKTIAMHRQILGTGPDVETDHINGNGKDNRRKNLRVCTHAQNMRNRGAYKGRRFKGVIHRTKNSFVAQIRSDGKSRYLGSYRTAEEAARAYDVAAIKYHGEFARLNFPIRQREDLTTIPSVTDELRLGEFFAVRRAWFFITQEPSRVAA